MNNEDAKELKRIMPHDTKVTIIKGKYLWGLAP